MPKKCPVCSSSANEEFVEVDGYSVLRCRTCATDFVAPTPSDKQLKEYYDRADWFEGGERGGYGSYDSQTDGSPDWLVKLFDEIEAGKTAPAILDIGCAYGTHLALAKERGWACFGVEPSEHARKTAQDRHRGIFIAETIEEIPPHKFDLILMLEVIEHLGDPYPMFYEMFAKGQISPETVIAITTPNARSWAALSDPAGWEFRHPPSHLTFYSALTFTTLLKRLRFSHIDVEGQHRLKTDAAPLYSDENQEGNEALAGYAGLKVIARGSDFSSFMQERFVPGTWSELTAYEHLPRYLFACHQAENRTVLDFGCGSGYGAKALSNVARHVLAIDIDDGALEFASSEHLGANLEFRKVDDLGARLEEASFDLITCFEVIEHLNESDQIQLLENFRRILRPDGVLFISTPNPAITSLYGDNPFHLKEMDLEEFRSALSRNFAHIAIFNQNLVSGSTLSRNGDTADQMLLATAMYPARQSMREAEAAWLALCSASELPQVAPCFYVDNDRDFVHHRVNEIASRNRDKVRIYEEAKRADEFELALGSATVEISRHESGEEAAEALLASRLSVVIEENAALKAANESLSEELANAQQHAANLEHLIASAKPGQEMLRLNHEQLTFAYDKSIADLAWTRGHADRLQSEVSASRQTKDFLQSIYNRLITEHETTLQELTVLRSNVVDFNNRLELTVHEGLELKASHEHLLSDYQKALTEISDLTRLADAQQQQYSATHASRENLTSDNARLIAERDQLATEARSLQQHVAALQARVHLIETSLRWRLMNKLARYAPALRPLINRVRALMSRSKALTQAADAQASFQSPTSDKDLAYETACEPKWNVRQNRYNFLVDEAYRARQTAKTGSMKNLVAPYVLRPKATAPEGAVLPKILHVIPNVYVGGSTQLIIDIVEHLSANFRHEVITSALWPAGSHEGLKVHHVTLANMETMQAILDQMKPDLVHLHYWGLSDDPWYWAAMEQVQRHGALPVVENINTPVEPLVSAHISQYVFVSNYVRKEFGNMLADDLASVIYPGIDLTKFSDPFDGEDALNAIGMVYRLEDDKLKIDAIDLFIEVVKRRPRTRVYIIGGGSFLEPWIKKTDEHGVRGNFRFTGYVPYEDLPGWYSRFSIFIAPVWKESFGQVAPFAMSKRLVVAGYKIGALPEIAGSDEFFGSDIDSTARIITDLLEDKAKRQRIGLENQERAATMFSVEAMTSAYQQLYRKLLDRNRQ